MCAMKSQFAKTQHGMIMVEVLVAILIFSIGIVGMINMQAATVKDVSQAGYRAEASYLASQMIGTMWADRGNLGAYALNAASSACATGTNSSTNPAVASWLQNDVARLPNATTLRHQIAVGTNNVVTVKVCWQAPTDTGPHNFTATAQIN